MEISHAPSSFQPGPAKSLRKRVRVIKKVRVAGGLWKFISLDRIGKRYMWDKRPGYYFLEWWEERRRRRESAGVTPSEALESQRRKQHELVGELMSGSKTSLSRAKEDTATLIADATHIFIGHVKVHSPINLLQFGATGRSWSISTASLGVRKSTSKQSRAPI